MLLINKTGTMITLLVFSEEIEATTVVHLRVPEPNPRPRLRLERHAPPPGLQHGKHGQVVGDPLARPVDLRQVDVVPHVGHDLDPGDLGRDLGVDRDVLLHVALHVEVAAAETVEGPADPRGVSSTSGYEDVVEATVFFSPAGRGPVRVLAPPAT